jgi:hypothetical protein
MMVLEGCKLWTETDISAAMMRTTIRCKLEQVDRLFGHVTCTIFVCDV